MKKVIAGVAAAGALAISMGISAIPASAGGDDKVEICHATGSTSNPYSAIEVNVEAVVKAGHNGTGDKGHPGDIYPAFSYTDKDGKAVSIPASVTWDTIVANGYTGAQIWTVAPGGKRACEIPEPVATPTPTDTATVTPEPTATETSAPPTTPPATETTTPPATESATPSPTSTDDVADTGAGLTSTALLWGGGFLGLGLVAVAGASLINTRRKH